MDLLIILRRSRALHNTECGMCDKQREKRTLLVGLTGTVGGKAGAGCSEAIGTEIN